MGIELYEGIVLFGENLLNLILRSRKLSKIAKKFSGLSVVFCKDVTDFFNQISYGNTTTTELKSFEKKIFKSQYRAYEGIQILKCFGKIKDLLT